jgi:UDP-glucose 4-epimerase
MGRHEVGVFGAGGFIGKRLVADMREGGVWEPVAFEGNLLKPEDIEAFFDEHPLGVVINLVGKFTGTPAELLTANVLTLHNLLDAAVRRGVTRVIQASTGAVYGEPPAGISKEEDPLDPCTVYGLTKRYAEECVEYFATRHGLGYALLRFPNVYGPESTKGVVAAFLKAIREQGKLTVSGTGEQKRNFLYVADAAAALSAALEHEEESGAFNIAGEEIMTLNEVIGTLRELGLTFSVEYAPTDAANTLQTLSLDSLKARERLGWSAEVPLREGLRRILAAS